uniref:Uncharacterized protein n=1 Tax=Fagus sylvatica TaxID=28930 RepID=A0A2N9HGC0_FAGSY
MAPKKSVSEGPRKRLKSKAQREETPSIDKSFRSSDHSVRFLKEISHRTVVFGKIVDFHYFDNHHIHLKELFEAQGWLTLESRLIHHIITHNILPRSGSYEYISYLDAFIIWCILNKVKLDLAFYVGWHMDTCVKKKNGALPYGLHITTILNHFKVNVSGEKETRNAIPTDFYGETTMKQMKYEFNNNTWVKKDAHVVEEMDEEAQMAEADAQGNEEARQEDQEPPTAPSSSSRVNEDNFQLMFGRLDSLATSGEHQTSFENFSSMVTQTFSTYNENFASLAQSMEEINERLRNHGM